MPDGCAEQLIRIEVEAGAIFEFVPDAAILFADSDFSQHVEVTLHPGALLLLHELVMPGRFARGEHLQFRRYANRLIVRDETGLICTTPQASNPHRMKFDTVSVFWKAIPAGAAPTCLATSKAHGIDAAAFCAAQHAADCPSVQICSARSTPLYRNGIGVRLLSQRLETIYAALSPNCAKPCGRSTSICQNAPLRK